MSDLYLKFLSAFSSPTAESPNSLGCPKRSAWVQPCLPVHQQPLCAPATLHCWSLLTPGALSHFCVFGYAAPSAWDNYPLPFIGQIDIPPFQWCAGEYLTTAISKSKKSPDLEHLMISVI